MVCRKCENEGTIIIKKDYSYCESCYLVYINHKFRACIGRNKIITPNEKIIIGLSGGIGSTVLLDLLHTGITLQNHKRLKLEPYFVHFTGQYEEKHDKIAQAIVQQCKSYGYHVHVVNNTSHTCNDNIWSSEVNTTCVTSSNDFIRRMKQNALASFAEKLKCRLIFTSECATNLAGKLLTNLVIGRGAQVEHDVGFSDNRYDNIKILRPLRDLTEEELRYYIKIRGLLPACDRPKQNSLQSVINVFVKTLESDSPSTISTICKTADKIGADKCNKNLSKCVFCKGTMEKFSNKLTAIEATNFSKIVSCDKQQEMELDRIISCDPKGSSEASMFPFIEKYLCYSCSRSYVSMQGTKWQECIKGLIENKNYI